MESLIKDVAQALQLGGSRIIFPEFSEKNQFQQWRCLVAQGGRAALISLFDETF